jgi:two-component system, chemotaxis family, CheB/CheR fusion protein
VAERRAVQIDDGEGLDRLLEYLKAKRGFDFTGYKRTSLSRSVAKRFDAVGANTYGDYLDYLEVHPDEFAELFDTILINVTSFFRDAPAWKLLAEEVLPGVVERKARADPIRVWCAGCASGEEAYTTAMVLAELVGADAFRERVKIYGTDIDEDAVTSARHGGYDEKALADVPSELVDRYFETSDSRKVFRPDLRRSVIFGRNDLVQDAPISRVDLLVCRNTLMYFTAETQSNILRRFHFALNDDGVLFIGKSEMLVTRGSLFTPINLKRRIFARIPRAIPARQRVQFTAPQVGGNGGNGDGTGESVVRAFDAGPIAAIVVDEHGALAAANSEARALFGLTKADLGRPLQDLEVSYRPVELRGSIDQAYADGHPVAVGPVDLTAGRADTRKLEVIVSPLLAGSSPLGASITFADVTQHHRLETDLERSKRELESAYEELQSTVEELETTNEELQSTNEELETTNEELQSANEELETMNEELQSTNEELETINDELRIRTTELHDVNGYLEAILAGMGVAVVVVDGEQRVQIWNSRAADLWGVRRDEAEGQHVFNLDIGLPVEVVRASLRAVLAGTVERADEVVAATNRRGKAIDCRVTSLPLAADGTLTGVIMLMEELDGGAGAAAGDGG